MACLSVFALKVGAGSMMPWLALRTVISCVVSDAGAEMPAIAFEMGCRTFAKEEVPVASPGKVPVHVR